MNELLYLDLVFFVGTNHMVQLLLLFIVVTSEWPSIWIWGNRDFSDLSNAFLTTFLIYSRILVSLEEWR